mgnify:CR=1 FL=1
MFTICSDPQAIFKTHNTGSNALIVSNVSLLLANFGFRGAFIYLPDKQHLSLTKISLFSTLHNEHFFEEYHIYVYAMY